MKITEITPQRKSSGEKIRLAAYCRVSTNSADQRHSFAAQIRYFSDYTDKHPQYRLVDIYADEGLSGTEMKKRDDLNRLLRDCGKGLIDRIIVKSVSRLARNTEELLVTLRMLKDLGVSVYFEEQGIDTDKLNMEMIVTFPGMAAQQESVSISGNMRWSCQKRMAAGDFACACPPYGYRRVDGETVVEEAEAAVIRRIFDLYLQGKGMQTIAGMLNREGAPRREGQRSWYSGTVRYVLTNERYTGDALLQKRFTTETLPFRRKANNGQLPKYYVENANPPIIRWEMFEKAQQLLHSRQSGGRKTNTYLLSGRLRCPQCGRSFRRMSKGGRAWWMCAGRSSGATDCQSRRIREDAVLDGFADMMMKLKENQSELLGTLIRQLETVQTLTSENQSHIREIDREIADLSAKNLVITRLHTGGILDAADYARQTAQLSGRLTELRILRRKKLTQDEDDALLDAARELYGILEEREPGLDFDADLFCQVVDRITVEDSAHLTFHLLGQIPLTQTIPEEGRCCA